MAVDAGSAVAYLDLNLKKYRQGFTQAMLDLNKFKSSFQSSTASLGAGMTSIGNGLVGIGTKLTMGLTTAIVGAGAAVMKMTADFDSKMSGVKATLGSTAEETAKLREQALKLGAATSFSASQAAEGMENLASAGFTTNEIMAAMPGLLDLAAAAGSDLAVASEIAAGTLRGFGLEAGEAGRVADVLAALAAKTNAAVEDTGEAMKYVAPVAKSYGLSLEEVSAAIGIMSNANIKGSQAGTTLRGALSKLAKPSDKAAEAMENMGFDAFDSTGKLKTLTQITADLAKGTKDYTDQEKAKAIVTIFGQEALSGMLVLMDAGPDKVSALTKELENSTGAAEEMANIRLDNLAGDIDGFTGSVESAGIALGTLLTPKIRELVQLATGLINKFNDLTDTQKTMVLKLAGIGAAAGPAIVGLGFLSKGAGSLITGFGNASAGIGTFATGGILKLKSFSKFTGGIFSDISKLSPFKAIGSGIDTLRLKGMYLGDSIKNKLGGAFTGLGNKVSPAIANFTKGIGREIPKVTGIVGKLGGGAISGLQTLVGSALKVFAPAVLVGAALLGLGAVYKQFGPEIDKVLDMVIQKGPEMITGFVNGIVSKIPELMEMGTTLVMKLLEAIIANLPAILNGAVQILVALVDGVTAALPRLIPMVLDLLNVIITALITNLPLIIQAGLQLILALAQGFADNSVEMIDMIVDLVIQIVEMLVENLPLIIECGIKIIVALIEGLAKALPELIARFPEIISAIFKIFTEIDWGKIGIDLITGIGKGVASAASGLANSVVAAAEGAMKGVKDFLGIRSPSKLMRDKVGKFIPAGIAEGIEAASGMVNSAVIGIAKGIDYGSFNPSISGPLGMPRSSSVSAGTQRVEHFGVITLKGYDNKDQFLGSTDVVVKQLGFETMLDYKKT